MNCRGIFPARNAYDWTYAATSRDEFASMRPGVYLLGLATLAAGILDLNCGDFDPGHQPIQAIGIIIPVARSLHIPPQSG